MEGNLRFKIDWGSLIVRCKLTIFIHGEAYFRNFTVLSTSVGDTGDK